MTPKGSPRRGVGPTATVGLVALCGSIGAGCSGEAGTPRWSGSVVDSAGVQLVHNDAVPDRPSWEAVPDLAIVPDSDRPETLFGHIVDLGVGDDGSVFVLDRMAQEVRTFDANGTYRGSIGRPGQGPGEFSAFAESLVAVADTLLVSDAARRNVQRFLVDGTFLSETPQPEPRSARLWWDGASTGFFVRSRETLTRDDGSWGSADRLLRVPADATRPSDRAPSADTLFRFVFPQSDIGARGNPKLPFIVNAPVWTALADGRWAWTHLEADRVWIHHATGALERVVTHEAWAARPASPDDHATLTSLMREKLTLLGGDPAAVDQLQVIAPERLPAVTGLVGDPSGALWVQRMGEVASVHPMALNAPEPPTGWGGTTWDVLALDGRWSHEVSLPPRFSLMTIRGDLLYGVQRTELDEEMVVRLRLRGPTAL